MASLEGGLGAIAFSSGLAAQLCTVLALAQAGDHLVCSQNVYGGTVTQFTVTVKRMGIETTFVSGRRPRRGARGDPAEYALAVGRDGRPTRRAQSPTRRRSPALPRRRRSAGGRQHVCLTRIFAGRSNTAPTSCSIPQRSSSADTERRSAAFWSSRARSRGATAAFRCSPNRVPATISKIFTETFGEYAFLMRARAEVLRDVGAQMSPMDAWLLLLGLETLARAHGRATLRNAETIAAFLKTRNEVVVGQRAAAGLDLHVWAARRPRSGTPVHRRARAVESSGQRRRRQESGHPSRFDHPLAALRRRTRQGRRAARVRAPFGRSRRRRRSHVGSRQRAGRGTPSGVAA